MIKWKIDKKLLRGKTRIVNMRRSPIRLLVMVIMIVTLIGVLISCTQTNTNIKFDLKNIQKKELNNHNIENKDDIINDLENKYAKKKKIKKVKKIKKKKPIKKKVKKVKKIKKKKPIKRKSRKSKKLRKRNL